MIRQKLHVRDLDVLLQAMELHAIGIVYVDVFLLRHRKELVVVKEASIPNCLTQLQFAPKLAFPPVHGRNMAFPPRQDQISSVSAVFADVGTHGVQLQLKPLLRHLNGNLALDLILADPVGAFEFRLGFEEAGCILEQNLGLLGFEGSCLVFVLESGEVAPQFLVLDVLDIDPTTAPVGFLRFPVTADAIQLGLGSEICPGIPHCESPIGLLNPGKGSIDRVNCVHVVECWR